MSKQVNHEAHEGHGVFLRNLRAFAVSPSLRRVVRVVVVLALGLAAGVGTWPVGAHGGGVTQVSAAAGPYHVTVWTAPQPVRAETPLHVTVAVADEGQRPVLDAAVLVELYGANGSDPVASGAATTAQSTNKLFYETDFSPPATGPHRVEVTVATTAGGGEVSFDLDIQPPRNTTWLVLALAALALLAAAGVFKGRPAEMPVRRRGREEGVNG